MPLFNGKDLTGWESPEPDNLTTWEFKGDELVAQSNSPTLGSIYTRRADYDNFHFRMETTLLENSHCGMLVRCGPYGEGAGGFRSYLIRIPGSTATPKITAGTLSLFAYPRCPTLLLANAAEVPLNAGEWFSLEVLAEGNRIRVLVKGTTVVDYVDANATYTSGRILLACPSNGVARYRKVEIKELEAARP